MYVRLKHTLSALALEALRNSAREGESAAAVWLAAYCDLVEKASGGDGAAESAAGRHFDVPLAAVAARAGRSAARPAGLSRVLDAGLLVRRNGVLSLPDAYRHHFPYMRRQVDRLKAALRAVHRAEADHQGEDVVRKGAALFNAGLFFESHEFFEDVWRSAPGGDRDFYQGLILVAAAFYHYEKRNPHGANIKLTQGLKRLERYPPTFHGVHLARWIDTLTPWRARIEAGDVIGVLNPSEIPRIPLSRASAGR